MDERKQGEDDMWIEGPGHREGWPQRIAWASFSGGLLGLLLVCLLVWVEQLEADPPPVTAEASGTVVVTVEFARAEPRIPQREAVVSVPLSAVLRTADSLEPYCYVAESASTRGVARFRRLVLGDVSGQRVVVRLGLEPGEAVVVRGQHDLVDGAALRVGAASLDPWPRIAGSHGGL